MQTSDSGRPITSALDGRMRIEEANGRLVVTGTDGIDKLLAGIDSDGNVRVKLAQDGIDVFNATDSELIWSSDFNSFKILETNTVTVPSITVDSNAPIRIVQNYPTTYDPSIVRPIVLAYIVNEDAQTKIVSNDTPTDDSTVGTETWGNLSGSPSTATNTITGLTTVSNTYPASTGNTLNDFTNPANVYVDDGIYATINVSDNGVDKNQDYYNFGFSFLADGTVTQISLEIQSHYTITSGGTTTPQITFEIYDYDSNSWIYTAPQNINLITDTTITFNIPISGGFYDTNIWNDNSYATGLRGRIRVTAGSGAAGNTFAVSIDYMKFTTIKYTSREVIDSSVKLILPGGGFGTEEKATSTALVINGDNSSVKSYGGIGDTWTETLTATDINNVDFGIVASYTSTADSNITHYIKVQNLGFAIPTGATISGILFRVSSWNTPDASTGNVVNFTNLVVTIYSSDNGTVQEWSSVVLGLASTAGIQIDTYLNRTLAAESGTLTFKLDAMTGLLNLGDYVFGPYDVRYYILVETAA
jgi:hypothetical protein